MGLLDTLLGKNTKETVSSAQQQLTALLLQNLDVEGTKESGQGLAEILRGQLPQFLNPNQDTESFTEPLFRQFREEILPNIRSQAIKFGAPGGSREGRVVGSAVERFGSGVAGALQRGRAGRQNSTLNALNSLPQGIIGLEQAPFSLLAQALKTVPDVRQRTSRGPLLNDIANIATTGAFLTNSGPFAK